jgi:hypothetical protein
LWNSQGPATTLSRTHIGAVVNNVDKRSLSTLLTTAPVAGPDGVVIAATIGADGGEDGPED